jgi:hypothetical protein
MVKIFQDVLGDDFGRNYLLFVNSFQRNWLTYLEVMMQMTLKDLLQKIIPQGREKICLILYFQQKVIQFSTFSNLLIHNREGTRRRSKGRSQKGCQYKRKRIISRRVGSFPKFVVILLKLICLTVNFKKKVEEAKEDIKQQVKEEIGRTKFKKIQRHEEGDHWQALKKDIQQMKKKKDF